MEERINPFIDINSFDIRDRSLTDCITVCNLLIGERGSFIIIENQQDLTALEDCFAG